MKAIDLIMLTAAAGAVFWLLTRKAAAAPPPAAKRPYDGYDAAGLGYYDMMGFTPVEVSPGVWAV